MRETLKEVFSPLNIIVCIASAVLTVIFAAIDGLIS